MSRPPQTGTYWALLALGIAPLYFNGYVNAQISDRPVAYWSFEFSYWVLLPVLVLVFLVRFGGLRMSDIGIHGHIRGRGSIGLLVLIALVLCPLYYLVHSSALRFFSTLLPASALFQYHTMVPESGIGRILVAAYFAITAGIVEEIYFRGLAFRACEMLPFSVPLYLGLSPILFALIHWESGAANTAATYVVGILAAATYVLLRNLWPLIVAHAYTDYAWFT